MNILTSGSRKRLLSISVDLLTSAVRHSLYLRHQNVCAEDRRCIQGSLSVTDFGRDSLSMVSQCLILLLSINASATASKYHRCKTCLLKELKKNVKNAFL